MSAFIDISGQKFGRLTAVQRVTKAGEKTKWLFSCECGKSHIATLNNVRSGKTLSCGCLHSEISARIARKISEKARCVNTIHGKKNERIYTTYSNMKARCYNQKNTHYSRYGGRGITVCTEWRNSPQAFFDWALKNGYTDELTIDRIDNDKGYCPENCRFVSQATQLRNNSRNVFVTINGSTKVLADWVKALGISRGKVARAMSQGMSPVEAIDYAVKGLSI
ncbi:hypothetical protein [Anaeromusa sp.]|uniref:hypothetical protein n=1 Tax=Anaeromusa sp. TaxID=1872520 RepID=UPI0026332EE7|nr:hypothetical protein [Anaeromusa sp.]MDD3157464.1 hypothetical protein [Anaeromusa sp.]